MAYVTANLVAIVPRMGQDGTAVWGYEGTDIHTDVDAADFFTDGDDKGLRVGDVMFVSKTTATIGTTVHYVQTVTSGGAATIAAAILA
jgi:hypothetical protein